MSDLSRILMFPCKGKKNNLLEDLLFHHKLEEASGNRVDETSNSYDLAPGNTPGNRAAKINNGVDLVRASSQYLSNADAGLNNIVSGSFTINWWAQSDSTTATMAMVGKYGTQRGILVENKAQNIRLTVSEDGTLSGDATGTTALGLTDHMFTLTYDSSTFDAKVFIDASDTPEVTVNRGGLHQSSTNYQIGVYGSTPTSPFDGWIDSHSGWTRVLTTAEITALYNSGNGLDYPF